MNDAFDTADVRRYYDRQTAGFLRLGQGGGIGAIHRAVWGPGTTNRLDAFRYVEDRIAALIAEMAERPQPRHILDLGCGVGASLSYLAGRLPIRGTGITLSPVQARIGAERIRAAGLADRVRCLEGDYCAVPEEIEQADLAYAIESFVHGPDPARFFAECARLIRPGGLLIVCDDFKQAAAPVEAARTFAQFQRGWHVNSLLTPAELIASADAAGFAHESTIDLSPYLEIGRPRDRAIDALLAVSSWFPWHRTPVAHLVGGSALQRCLAKGWIRYELVQFRRRPAGSAAT